MLARNGYGEMPEYDPELEGGFSHVCCPGKRNKMSALDFCYFRFLLAKKTSSRSKKEQFDRAGLDRQRRNDSLACQILIARRMELSRGDGNLPDARL